MSAHSKRLAALRELLPANEVEAYLIRTADCHNSEYLANPDKRIAFLSGFTGSNATIVVSANQALLWTDGRYFDQAAKQLNNEWTLMKDRMPNVPSVEDWLASNIGEGPVGIDPTLMTINEWTVLRQQKVNLRPLAKNLIDIVWADDKTSPRPQYSKEKVFALPIDKTGQSVADKLAVLRKKLKSDEVFVFTALDEVAWLVNMRGSDIPYNPVFFSYATVSPNGAQLYMDPDKLTDAAKQHLSEANVHIRDYGAIWKDLTQLESKRVFTSKGSSVAIMDHLGGKCSLLDLSPIARLKAAKNHVEQEGMRVAHLKDAVAMCEFLYTVSKNPESFDELSAEALVDSLRAAQKDYVSPSFRTISGYGPNASVIHYNSSEQSNLPLGKDNMYLVDSGGQYLDGTTDITRTVHFGVPSEKDRKCFTAVLKGHLALATSKFPETAAASRLDTIARKPLWDLGMDYGHGTGHGVGCCLNVHEGPFSISERLANKEPLYPGAVASDEPGYYESGKFGIRIENLVLCQADAIPGYLRFEYLTLVPIDLKLVDRKMLDEREIEALNDYHRQVREKVIPELKRQQKAQEIVDWVHEATKPLS